MALLCRVLVQSLAFHLVWAATHTVTIDDSVGAGTPSYTPPEAWQDQNCAGCWLVPDKGKASRGTWHGATYNPGKGAMYFDLSFEGTGIDVYFIMANTMPRNPTTDTKASFLLDGKPDGPTFQRTHDSTSNYLYNQKIYSKGGLAQAKHTLRVGILDANDQGSYWMAFDYAVVTVQDPEPPAKPATIVSTIIRDPSTATAKSAVPPSSIITTVLSSLAGVPTPVSSNQPSNGGDVGQDQRDTSTSTNVAQSSGASSNNGPVIGGVVAAIIVIAALGFLAFLFLRRRRRASKSHDTLLHDGRPMSTYWSEHSAAVSEVPSTSFFAPAPAPSTSSHGLAPSRYTSTPTPYNVYNAYTTSSVDAPRNIHETHAQELARRDARQQELEAQMAQMQKQLDVQQPPSSQSTNKGPSATEEKAALRARADATRNQNGQQYPPQPPEYTPDPY